MGKTRAALTWAALGVALSLPLAFAATSPLLQWRQPVYIAAGFAGVIAMALLLLQPLLAAGLLPGIARTRARRIHRWTGAALVLSVVIHVTGLWITSPPDVIDALTFTSPTLFTPFGVIAMWALFGTATLALARQNIRHRTWAIAHGTLAALIVTTSVVHAMLIEGTMESFSKAALCALALLATARALLSLWQRLRRP